VSFQSQREWLPSCLYGNIFLRSRSGPVAPWATARRLTPGELDYSITTDTAVFSGPLRWTRRVHLDSCAGCHVQRWEDSTCINPNCSASTVEPGNTVPLYHRNGPVREARSQEHGGSPDGGVHDVFTMLASDKPMACHQQGISGSRPTTT